MLQHAAVSHGVGWAVQLADSSPSTPTWQAHWLASRSAAGVTVNEQAEKIVALQSLQAAMHQGGVTKIPSTTNQNTHKAVRMVSNK